MTCHAIERSNKLARKDKTEEQKARIREQNNKRQQKKRALAKKLAASEQEEQAKTGGVKLNFGANELPKVSDTELAQLGAQALTRDFDSVSEYLMTLMRIDGERIKQDQEAIGTCNSCNLPLPKGCDAVFKGQLSCSYIQGLPLVTTYHWSKLLKRK